MSKTMLVLFPIFALLALVGAVSGVYAVVHDPSTTTITRQVRVLRVDTATNTRQITALKSDSQAGAVQALQASVHGLSLTMAGVQKGLGLWGICLPQLSQEINGLNVQNDTTGGYVTDAYLQNQTIISSNCTKILDGASTGP